MNVLSLKFQASYSISTNHNTVLLLVERFMMNKPQITLKVPLTIYITDEPQKIVNKNSNETHNKSHLIGL